MQCAYGHGSVASARRGLASCSTDGCLLPMQTGRRSCKHRLAQRGTHVCHSAPTSEQLALESFTSSAGLIYFAEICQQTKPHTRHHNLYACSSQARAACYIWRGPCCSEQQITRMWLLTPCMELCFVWSSSSSRVVRDQVRVLAASPCMVDTGLSQTSAGASAGAMTSWS